MNTEITSLLLSTQATNAMLSGQLDDCQRQLDALRKDSKREAGESARQLQQLAEESKRIIETQLREKSQSERRALDLQQQVAELSKELMLARSTIAEVAQQQHSLSGSDAAALLQAQQEQQKLIEEIGRLNRELEAEHMQRQQSAAVPSLDSIVLSEHLRLAQADIEKMTSQIRQLQSDINSARQKQQVAEKDADESRRATAALQQENTELSSQIELMEQERDDLHDQISSMQQELVQKNKSIDDLLEQTRKQVNSVQAASLATTIPAAQLDSNPDQNLETRCKALQRLVDSMQSEKEGIQQDFERKLDGLSAAKLQLEQQLREACSRLDGVSGELQKSQTEVYLLQMRYNTALSRIPGNGELALGQSNRTARDSLDITKKVSQLSESNKRMEEQIAELEKQLRNKDSKLHDISAVKHKLEQKEKLVEVEVETLKSELSKTQSQYKAALERIDSMHREMAEALQQAQEQNSVIGGRYQKLLLDAQRSMQQQQNMAKFRDATIGEYGKSNSQELAQTRDALLRQQTLVQELENLLAQSRSRADEAMARVKAVQQECSALQEALLEEKRQSSLLKAQCDEDGQLLQRAATRNAQLETKLEMAEHEATLLKEQLRRRENEQIDSQIAKSRQVLQIGLFEDSRELGLAQTLKRDQSILELHKSIAKREEEIASGKRIRAELEQQLYALQKRADGVAHELADAYARNRNLENLLREKEAEIFSLTATVNSSRVELETGSKSRKMVYDQIAQLDGEYRAVLANKDSDLKKERSTREQLQNALKDAMVDLEKCQIRIQDLMERLASSDRAYAALRENNEILQAQLLSAGTRNQSLEDEISSLKENVFTNSQDVREFTDKLKTNRMEQQALVDEISRLRREVMAAQEQAQQALDSLQQQILSNKQDMDNAGNRISKLTQTIRLAEQENASLQHEIERLRHELSATQDEYRLLSSEFQRTEGADKLQIDNLQSRLQQAADEQQILHVEIERLHRELSSAVQANNMAQEELQQLHTITHSSQHKMQEEFGRQLQDALTQAESENSKLRDSMRLLEAESTRLHKHLQETKASFSQTTNDLQQQRETNALLTTEIAGLKRRISEDEKEQAISLVELTSTRKERDELQSRLKALEQQIEEIVNNRMISQKELVENMDALRKSLRDAQQKLGKRDDELQRIRLVLLSSVEDDSSQAEDIIADSASYIRHQLEALQELAGQVAEMEMQQHRHQRSIFAVKQKIVEKDNALSESRTTLQKLQERFDATKKQADSSEAMLQRVSQVLEQYQPATDGTEASKPNSNPVHAIQSCLLELDGLRQMHQQAEDEISSLKRQLREKQNELADIRMAHDDTKLDADGRRKQLEEQVSSLKNEIARLQEQLEAQQEELESAVEYKSKHENAAKQNVLLQLQNQKQQRDITSLTQHLSELEDKHGSTLKMLQQYKETERKYEDIAEAKRRIEEQLIKAQQEADKLRQQLRQRELSPQPDGEMTLRMSQLTDELNVLAQQKKEAESSISTLRTRVAQLQEELQRTQRGLIREKNLLVHQTEVFATDLQKLKKSLRDARDYIQQLKQTTDNFEQYQQSANKMRKVLRSTITQLQQRLQEINQLISRRNFMDADTLLDEIRNAIQLGLLLERTSAPPSAASSAQAQAQTQAQPLSPTRPETVAQLDQKLATLDRRISTTKAPLLPVDAFSEDGQSESGISAFTESDQGSNETASTAAESVQQAASFNQNIGADGPRTLEPAEVIASMQKLASRSRLRRPPAQPAPKQQNRTVFRSRSNSQKSLADSLGSL